MSTLLAARLRPRLARLAAPPDTDADLLRRFVADRDEDAFGALVRRHGPAVLGVCRRITRNPHDADDAFQAAFLVLARKADRVRPGEPLAAWLYGVAVRAARATLSRAYRHRSRERGGELPDVPARPADGIDADDARAVLDEVARLSPGVRAAVVLCELEGRSRAAAARELGIPEGTLSSRLAAARKVLAARLRDRGLAAAVLAAVAADARGRHPVWSSELPSRVTELAEAVMRTGFAFKWKLAAVVLAAVGLVAAHAKPPADEAPAPRPADPSRLIVGFPGHVRYLTPDGREVGRVTGDQVQAAGAMMFARTTQNGVSSRGIAVNPNATFAPCGRPAPDGRLPVFTGGGLRLFAAGPPAAAVLVKGKDGKALFAGEDTPNLVAWSPDGTKAIGTRTIERTFAPNTPVNTLVDLAAGTATPLKLPAGHAVLDWAPDGSWFLTLHTKEWFSLPDVGWRVHHTLCRVSADGAAVEELAEPRAFVWHAAISPDGAKVAYGRGTTGTVEVGPGKQMEVFNGFEVVVLDLATMTRAAVLASPPAREFNTGEVTAGVRWSPDGTRLAAASIVLAPRDGGALLWQSRVRVCDADGGNARVVLDGVPKAADHLSPMPTVFDWR